METPADKKEVAGKERRSSRVPRCKPLQWIASANNNIILLFDIKTRTKWSYSTPKSLADTAVAVVVETSAYLFSRTLSVTVTELKILPTGLETMSRANMLCPRYEFPSVCLCRRYIYLISGMSNGTLIRSCHRYDINTNTWAVTPSVNKARDAHGACTLNDRYIYIYGGFANGSLKTFERIDTLEEYLGWEYVDFINLNRKWSMRFEVAAVQQSNLSVLLCGGSHINDYTSTYDFFYLVNTVQNRTSSMSIADGFATAPVLYAGKAYFLSRTRIHIHDLHIDTWSAVNTSDFGTSTN